MSGMIFQKGCSRKFYWAYEKPTLEEAPALWIRLSGKELLSE